MFHVKHFNRIKQEVPTNCLLLCAIEAEKNSV